MKKSVIYIHGRGGSPKEAEFYRPFLGDREIIGFDYKSDNPWQAQREFADFYDLHGREYDSVILIANSIGAYFSLVSLADKRIDKALLISPVVDMEKLIGDMMMRARVSEKELAKRKEIVDEFGETLSWEYLCFVREHPIKWSIPTCILYGERDNLTSLDTISRFAEKTGASLTVMPNGEHWFHTAEQMEFLENWAERSIK